MSVDQRPEPIPADDPGRVSSAKRGMAAAVLSLEAIVLGLTTPVMISIAHVAWQAAVPVGCGLCIICIVLAGMLRRPWAYAAGWAVQLASIALGTVVGMMYVLGVVFLLLWWGAIAVGNKIERERAAAYAEYDRMTGDVTQS